MKKAAVYAVFLTILAVMGYQAVKIGWQLRGLDAQYSQLKQQNTYFTANNSTLEQQIKFYSDPYNLEKEVKSRLNYIVPGEKMIIVVPSTSTQTQSTNSKP